jgi:hypothetical protein
MTQKMGTLYVRKAIVARRRNKPVPLTLYAAIYPRTMSTTPSRVRLWV